MEDLRMKNAMKELENFCVSKGYELLAPMNPHHVDDVIVICGDKIGLFSIKDNGTFAGGVVPSEDYPVIAAAYLKEKAVYPNYTHLGFWLYEDYEIHYPSNHDFSIGEVCRLLEEK